MQHLRSFTSIILVCQGGVYFGGARRKIASASVAIASNDATHHEHRIEEHAIASNAATEGAAEKYTREHTVKFFKADAVESVLPLPPKDYPEALQGVIWMDQIGAYGYSDITSGAPDAAISFGDPANVLDAENKRINVDVSGTAFQWFNNFEGYAAWKLLHSINFKYIFQFNDDYTHAQIDPSVSVFSVPKSFTSFTMELQTPQPGECPPAEGATKQEISKCAKWKRISTVAGGEEKLYYVFEIIDKDGTRVQPYYDKYVEWVNSHVDPDSGSAWWAGVRGDGLEDPSNAAFVGLESTEH